MRIVVSATAEDPGAEASPRFGRCPAYVFVDTERLAFEPVSNPAMGAAGGAGVQAAQFVLEHGAQVVVTGRVGPYAMGVLEQAGVPVFSLEGGTVREVAEAYRAGELRPLEAAGPPGSGSRGRGRGRGMRAGRAVMAAKPPSEDIEEESQGSVEDLREELAGLRGQLAELLERLDQIEKEE
jgi:predicted Fe-Mo cluster-binding NifX family protein